MLANFGVRGSMGPEFHHRERGILQAWTAAYCAVIMGLLLSSPPAIAAGRVFYDGFESGNTNLWSQEDGRNKCQVVEQSVDGIAGPLSGSRMVRCNWNGTVGSFAPDRFETLLLTSLPSTTNELFYRFRHRLDQDVDRIPGSAGKMLRLYRMYSTFEVFDIAANSLGLHNQWAFSGNAARYGGGNAGDTTASSSEWNTTEYYLNRSNGSLKVWHDDVLIHDVTGTYTDSDWANTLHILSNFFDSHDNSNHVYFDDIEVFTEVGNTATGSMADGTVLVGSAPESPTGLSVR